MFEDVAAVLKHLFEIVRIGSKNLDVDFVDAMLQNIPEDFLFLGCEFKALHIVSLRCYGCPLMSSGVS